MLSLKVQDTREPLKLNLLAFGAPVRCFVWVTFLNFIRSHPFPFRFQSQWLIFLGPELIGRPSFGSMNVFQFFQNIYKIIDVINVIQF